MNYMQSKVIASIVGFVVLATAGAYGFNYYQSFRADKSELLYWQELAKKKEKGDLYIKEIIDRKAELKDDKPENDSMALAFIAANAATLGDSQGAIKYYQHALALDPKNRLALNNIANTYQDLGDWNSAEKYFLQLISVYPDYIPAYRLLGYLYWYRFNNPEEQIKSLVDQGLRATNDNAELLSWIITYYQETGQNDKAVPYSQKLANKLNQKQ